MPRRLRFGRWALTPPFHPYPDLATVAVCSLWHCLSRKTFVLRARGQAGFLRLSPSATGFRGPVP